MSPLLRGGRKGPLSSPPSFKDCGLGLPPRAGAEAGSRLALALWGGGPRTIITAWSSRLEPALCFLPFPSGLPSRVPHGPHAFRVVPDFSGQESISSRWFDCPYFGLLLTAWSLHDKPSGPHWRKATVPRFCYLLLHHLPHSLRPRRALSSPKDKPYKARTSPGPTTTLEVQDHLAGRNGVL